MRALGHWVKACSIAITIPSAGTLPCDRARREQVAVVGDDRPAVDTEGVTDSGDQEQQRDPVVGEKVGEGVGDPVARAIGEQQRALVKHVDEAGRVAPRGYVEAASGASRGDAQKRGGVDELTGEIVDAGR